MLVLVEQVQPVVFGMPVTNLFVWFDMTQVLAQVSADWATFV